MNARMRFSFTTITETFEDASVNKLVTSVADFGACFAASETIYEAASNAIIKRLSNIVIMGPIVGTWTINKWFVL